MSYTQIPNETIMPTSEIYIANANTVGQKELKVIYPVENSAVYGRGYAGSAQELSFNIASNHQAWLPQESYLEFSLAMGTTAGFLPGSVDAVFSKVRVLSPQGTVLLEDQSANVFSRIQQIATISDQNKALCWEENLNSLCVNTDDPQNVITTTPTQYSMKLKQPFFRQLASIPLPITGQLRLVFSLAVDNQAITYATGDSYKLTSPRLLCSMLGYSADFLDKLRIVAEKGGLLLSYVQNYYAGAPSSIAGDNVCAVNFGCKNVLGAIIVNRIPANDSSSSRVEKLGRYLCPITLNSIYAQIGSDQYPQAQITNYTRAWCELKKYLGLWGDLDAGNQISRSKYEYSSATNAILRSDTCSKFICGIDFRSDSGTGIDTGTQGLITIHQQFGEANSGFFCDCYIQYQSVFMVRNSREIFPLHL